MEERKKRPRKPKELENQPGRYDKRNTLNDLTGKEWLLLTKSFWERKENVIHIVLRISIMVLLENPIKYILVRYTQRKMLFCK